MHSTVHQIWKNPYIRLASLLVLAAVLIWFFYNTRGAWVLFLLAYTVAYLVNPIVLWLQRHRLPRWAGVGTVLLGLLLLLVAASLVVTQFVQQATELVQELPDIGEQLMVWYERLPGFLQRVAPTPVVDFLNQPGAVPEGDLEDELIGPFENLVGDLGEFLGQVGSNVFAFLAGFVGGVLQSVVLVFLILFLLYDFQGLNRTFLRTIPERHRSGGLELLRKLDVSVGGYIRGQLLIAAVVAFCIWLGLTLLGVPLALGIGFIAGIFNIVPFLGPIVAFIPAALLSLTLGWPYLLATAVLFMVINFLDGNVISPLIFSQTIKLHPLTVILSVAVGASLLGFLGAIIAVPAAAFFKLLYEDYYLTSRWYEKDEPEGAR